MLARLEIQVFASLSFQTACTRFSKCFQSLFLKCITNLDARKCKSVGLKLLVHLDLLLTILFVLSMVFFRLLLAEKMGHLCRDDSVEGLRFYPNLFLST